MATTITPAIGEKMKAANIAGASLKSIFKYGGKNGNGKFKKNSNNEIVPSKASTMSLSNFDDDCVLFTINLLLHLHIDYIRDEGIPAYSIKKTPKPNKRYQGLKFNRK